MVTASRFLILSCMLAFGLAQEAQAYPEFIAYGYTACLTCHFNSLGGGPLNDYGRALLSGEISSRLIYSKTKSDDDIAAQSGFLGKTELPSWLRPHLNYREMQLRQNPGGGASDQSHTLQMQSDVGLTMPFGQGGKYLVSATWGHVIQTQDYGMAKEGAFSRMLAREYYARVEVAKRTWVYAGVMDKAFGIRNVNHDSFQRQYQGFNQFPNSLHGSSESLGVIVHKGDPNYDIAGNIFAGNPYDDAAHKQSGFSGMGEYQIGNKQRLGGSLMMAKSELLKKNVAAVHYRQGLSKGSALLAEYGLIQDQAPGDTIKLGSYNLIEGFLRFTRGYNLRTTIERYNQEFKPASQDTWRWTVGMMMFPLPRIELLADIVNQRGFSDRGAVPDTWMLEGQLHVSL